MHNFRFSQVLVISFISLLFLVGFEDKFSEKNQTGSPRIKKDVKTEVIADKNSKSGHDEFMDEPINLEVAPPSEDRKKFDGWYSDLEERVRNKKDWQSRLDLLHQGLAKIEKDREKLLNLNFNEEIEIDFLIKPLKILPKISQFKVENCTDYKMKILSQFDPTSEQDSKDLSLKKALNMFKLICTQ